MSTEEEKTYAKKGFVMLNGKLLTPAQAAKLKAEEEAAVISREELRRQAAPRRNYPEGSK